MCFFIAVLDLSVYRILHSHHPHQQYSSFDHLNPFTVLVVQINFKGMDLCVGILWHALYTKRLDGFK